MMSFWVIYLLIFALENRSEAVSDLEIVSPLSTQLGWSHFVEVMPINDEAKRVFYLQKAAEENWKISCIIY